MSNDRKQRVKWIMKLKPNNMLVSNDVSAILLRFDAVTSMPILFLLLSVFFVSFPLSAPCAFIQLTFISRMRSNIRSLFFIKSFQLISVKSDSGCHRNGRRLDA